MVLPATTGWGFQLWSFTAGPFLLPLCQDAKCLCDPTTAGMVEDSHCVIGSSRGATYPAGWSGTLLGDRCPLAGTHL